MQLSGKLQDLISADDTHRLQDTISRSPSISQEELDQYLVSAMPEGSIGMIRMLIQHGAKLKVLSYHSAIAREDPLVFQTLIDNGWDINSTQFELPLIQSAIRCEKLLRWLLEHSADPNTKSVRRRRGSCLKPSTPLTYAANFPDPTPVETLLSHGAEMDPEALFYAIGFRRREDYGLTTMALLIDHGADVNHVSREWATPLHHCVKQNTKDKLKFLLDHGADPHARSFAGTTASDSAKALGRTDLYEILEELCAAREP